MYYESCFHLADTADIAAALNKFEKFEKMKKLLPEGAVRQKMTMEGIPAAEIEDFLAGKTKKPEPPVDSSMPSTSTKKGGSLLEERVAKFERLQKLLLEAALLPPSPTTNALLTVFDERLARYEKMYRMLHDDAAVRRKMVAQGCTAAEVEKFFQIIHSASISPTNSTAEVENIDGFAFTLQLFYIADSGHVRFRREEGWGGWVTGTGAANSATRWYAAEAESAAGG